jgi:hypothetical protein
VLPGGRLEELRLAVWPVEKQMKTGVFQLGGHPVWLLPADCPWDASSGYSVLLGG